LNRREWLHAAALMAFVSGCGGGGSSSSASPPNVLFVSIDDLNDWVGFLGGHPQVRTPALDALAARSSVFRRAYCAAPVCSASRATVLSGLSVENTHVYYNDQTFLGVNPGKKQLDDMFADAGYLTQRYGKVDHSYSTHVEQPLPSPMPYANKVCAEPLGEGAFDWGPAPGGDEAQPDYQYAQSGIDFLRAEHDKPFFLAVGFARPHVGWYVPQRFFDMYPKETLQLPPAPPDDLDDLGPAGKAIALQYNFHQCITGQNLWADAVQAYLASISWADTQLARLIAALDASAYKENTIVVVWSDHGFHLGEKFHWHKLALWERATRVPLLIRLPGQAARADVDALVSLRDLAPTLLERCNVTPAYAMDGRSLNPLLSDPDTAWDHPVLTTKDQHDHAIRSADWRYIRYASGERELYDEKADPGELHNLAGDGRYESVMAQLDALMPPKP
jgi:arylsulfatase A-like enzyme